jgi:hypothetical protein
VSAGSARARDRPPASVVERETLANRSASPPPEGEPGLDRLDARGGVAGMVKEGKQREGVDVSS